MAFSMPSPDEQFVEGEREGSNRFSRLARRLAADVAAGGLSALLVSPALTIMDRAIVEQAATGRSLLTGLLTHGLSSLKRPGFLLSSTPMRIIFTLYATTYVVANSADTLCREFSTEAMAGPVVFISTFAFNVPLGIWKDVRFSQLFGAKVDASSRPAEATKLAKGAPRSATAAFLIRDAITIFGSFTLPGVVSGLLPRGLMPDPASMAVFTQLSVPMLSQLAATPIHLMGLDFYSRPGSLSYRQRFSDIRGYIPSTTVGRCLRIIPAFGFGVLANTAMRESLHTRIEDLPSRNAEVARRSL